MRKTSFSIDPSKKPFRECACTACTIDAPCKINLHLRIGERRPDGFHNLESIFASLALGDALRFECGGEEGETRLSVNWETGCSPEMPGGEVPKDAHTDAPPVETPPIEDNSVLKAISLFREQVGFKPGLNIRLNKRVPVGAGLGGGSSDAASTLLALNSLSERLCSAHLSLDDLKKMAESLGSDVPFFLTGGTAFVGGRGELVEPVKPLRGLWVVLVKPPFSSDTASAYRLLDRFREHKMEKKEEFARDAILKKELIRSLEGKIETWPFYNDFLSVFLSCPLGNREETDLCAAKAGFYRDILESLRVLGALFVGLSGAGSCCFGIFCGKKAAEKAAQKLAQQGNFTRLTFFLAHYAIPVLK